VVVKNVTSLFRWVSYCAKHRVNGADEWDQELINRVPDGFMPIEIIDPQQMTDSPGWNSTTLLPVRNTATLSEAQNPAGLSDVLCTSVCGPLLDSGIIN
jgi:hypothetical protein